jgi:DNA-binding NarL/FixJ family response regulator
MSIENKKVSFLLADDHSLIRQGIVFLLEEMAFESEVFHASSLPKIMETLEKYPIDILIMDAHFPDGNSITILEDIKIISPETKILIFTGIDEATQSLKYLNAGANGFISKLSEEDDVKKAIIKIYEEGEYISPLTRNLMMDSFRNPRLINPLYRLTEREMEIADMYAQGLGNLEIANRLQIKQNTVSTIKKRIFEKLNVDNILELVEMIKNHS